MIGMVGGIGPESTIDYYRSLIALSRERGLGGALRLLIHSIDVDRLLTLAAANDKTDLIDYLVWSVDTLARGGADVALLAANTPHIVFDEVAARVPIPLVSIVAATCDVAERLGLRRLGLIGTRFTMQGGFYQSVFAARGLVVIVPDDDDQAFVHSTYVTELLRGAFSKKTREGVIDVLNRLRERSSIDGVILGGTELPLLLRGVDYALPLLDTTRIHAEAAIARAG
jgi:aspartate racemase